MEKNDFKKLITGIEQVIEQKHGENTVLQH